MIKLKVKNIEMALQEVEAFTKPKVELEQYVTDARTAAEVLFMIEKNYEDLSGMNVADFGSGPGIFSIGAALLGAEQVTGYEIDKDAIAIAKQNVENMELVETIEFFNADISQLNLKTKGFYDTIVMNPPFGTRKEGIDMVFLKKALENCSGAVYSLHKTNTVEFIKKQCKTWGAKFESLGTVNFPLPKVFKHQTKDKTTVEVDIIRVENGDA